LIRNFFKEAQEIPEGSTSKRSRRKGTSDKTQSTPTHTVKKTKEKTEGKNPIKKRSIEAIHQNPSSEEDHQVLSERIVHLQSAMTKKKGKEKQKEKDSSPQYVRRSNGLKGNMRKVQTKGPHFIDLGEVTPEQTPAGSSPSRAQPNIEASPQDVDMNPFWPDFEENSPPQYFGDSPRKTTPEIDPKQQKVYDYIEYLERIATGPSTSSTQPHIAQEDLTKSLKQEIFELEVLNRHIKNENEALKEQNRLDKIIHDNTMLHLGLWHKKNRKLEKKCRKLSKALINLKFRCLMKKPRMLAASRKKRIILDVLA